MVETIIERLNALLKLHRLLLTHLFAIESPLDDDSVLHGTLFTRSRSMPNVTNSTAGQYSVTLAMRTEVPVLRLLGVLNYVLWQHGYRTIIAAQPANISGDPDMYTTIGKFVPVNRDDGSSTQLLPITPDSFRDKLTALLQSTPMALEQCVLTSIISMLPIKEMPYNSNEFTYAQRQLHTVTGLRLLNYCFFGTQQASLVIPAFNEADDREILLGFTSRELAEDVKPVPYVAPIRFTEEDIAGKQEAGTVLSCFCGATTVHGQQLRLVLVEVLNAGNLLVAERPGPPLRQGDRVAIYPLKGWAHPLAVRLIP